MALLGIYSVQGCVGYATKAEGAGGGGSNAQEAPLSRRPAHGSWRPGAQLLGTPRWQQVGSVQGCGSLGECSSALVEMPSPV